MALQYPFAFSKSQIQPRLYVPEETSRSPNDQHTDSKPHEFRHRTTTANIGHGYWRSEDVVQARDLVVIDVVDVAVSDFRVRVAAVLFKYGVDVPLCDVTDDSYCAASSMLHLRQLSG